MFTPAILFSLKAGFESFHMQKINTISLRPLMLSPRLSPPNAKLTCYNFITPAYLPPHITYRQIYEIMRFAA